MCNELERICKEVVIVYSRYPAICLEGLRKNRKSSAKAACVAAESRTEQLPNTRVQRYRYADLHDVKPRNPVKFNDVSEECTAFIFVVEE
jgi:hypothetical protein